MTVDDSIELTLSEQFSLEQYEVIIEDGLKTFVEVGQALGTIRDARLYRVGHDTFEAYCDKRWNLSRKRAYDLMGAAETVAALSPIGDTPIPTTESQARELRGMEPEPAAEVMRRAHDATEGKVTAKAIREVRDRVIADKAEADVAEFPALNHYAERGRPADVVRLAGALRQYDAPERARRLDILGKTIAAEKRAESPARHLSVAPDSGPDYRDAFNRLLSLAQQINAIDIEPAELARAIARHDWDIRAAMSWLVTFIESTPDGASHE